MCAIAAEQLKSDGRFCVKFGSVNAAEEAKADLIGRQRVFKIPGVPDNIGYGFSKSGLILRIGK